MSSAGRERLWGWHSCWSSGSWDVPRMGDSLRSQITPEQAVRAYVQLIIDGKYSEAEKVIPARDKRCGGRSCRVGDDISELRVEAPQLLDVTVSKDCGERHVRCSAKVRLLVGGVEQEYQ